MEDNHIADDRARRFVAGLRRFEQDSDTAVFAALFAPDAVTERLDARGERQGEVAEFWREYRDQFQEVRTTFFNVVEGDDQFALEWTSSGTLRDDRPIDYRGVTVIDLDGDAITRLRTYYDSAAFVLVPAEST
ncbi:nuclear transport factor 2 family protein [Pseudonocardia sp.]|uniref:nuclear transport factor 2 family protein n=1 Tax=Pseudonocardia sp. TaxID=60912 RepID=UPI00262C5A90|nr:nuclear transport factor 2 family protein [Pseudonocardia sp.]